MSEYTLQVTQSGFHGQRTIPVRGSQWTWFGGDRIDCHMSPEAVREMRRGMSCGAHPCKCGGYFGANEQLYAWWTIPFAWIKPEDRAACPDLDKACRKLEEALELV